MIISDEQARLAAQYLQESHSDPGTAHEDVSSELMERVIAAVQHAPETRVDRVREAITHLHAGAPDSHEVASKMISRIISDSLR